jgi:hypothetical protein
MSTLNAHVRAKNAQRRVIGAHQGFQMIKFSR